MNINEAKTLKKEYDIERNRLFERGENLYGKSDKYNDTAGWYADTEIKKHKKYDLWSKAIRQLNYKFNSGYSRYTSKQPKKEYKSLEEELITSVADANAYILDIGVIKTFKQLSKQL